MRALFKTYGIRKFLQWLQKYPKKYDLDPLDCLAYKQHIEGVVEPPKETETTS
jgi:vacuolar-type H+-ATPase subunit C/Vma6